MLTFQCDAGYMPQNEMTSTCLSKEHWVPIPECKGIIKFLVLFKSRHFCTIFTLVIDCGIPFGAPGVVIEPSNNTFLDALISFQCEESNTTMTAVCGNNGQWAPNPMSLKCGTGRLIMFYEHHSSC